MSVDLFIGTILIIMLLTLKCFSLMKDRDKWRSEARFLQKYVKTPEE